MNYSIDTSTATTTRLRTLQSSSMLPSSTATTNTNNNHINNATTNNSINQKNLIVIAQTAFIPHSNSANLNHHNQPLIGQTVMMMSSSGNATKLGHRDRTNAGEIEPLLSSASNSASTSATTSPMHETYKANDQIIVHNDTNSKIHKTNKHEEIDGSIGLVIEPSGSGSSHHRNGHSNDSSLGQHNLISQTEGDSIHSSNEESSSLLAAIDREHYVIQRTTPQSLKNVIILNLLALLFVSLMMIFNLLVISVIHERVPMSEPHLPDIAFDILPDHRHFLDIAEYVICIQSFCIAVLLFFHKYRSTILRRICVIMGVIYFFRGLCMASTQLPLASKNYYCSPQLRNMSGYENITSIQFIEIVVSRVFYMSLGMGLSINGHHTFCGDYIFSGHTVILILAYLIHQEYLLPSRRRTLVWKCIDLIQIIMTLTSVICILIARGHYFIDIIIAYFVTTRIFWMYHTMCNFLPTHFKSHSNHLNRVWWCQIFLFLEDIRIMQPPPSSSASMSNHRHYSNHNKNADHRYHNNHNTDKVQRIFEWPLDWPKRFARRSKHRGSHHQFTA